MEPECFHAKTDALLSERCFEDMRHVGQCKRVLLSSFSTVLGSEGALAKHPVLVCLQTVPQLHSTCGVHDARQLGHAMQCGLCH